jgi:hypothetical protein
MKYWSEMNKISGGHLPLKKGRFFFEIGGEKRMA